MGSDGKLIIETEIDSSNLDDFINALPEKTKNKIGKASKEIDRLSQKFGELASEYFSLTDSSKGSIIFRSDAKEAEKLKGEIRSVVKEIEKLTGDKVISIKGITDLDDATGKLARNTDINFKKMGNTIKKFGLSLIGLRSIYSLVSRASSAYLSQDVELAEKLRSVWVGLGSFLAPVLEFISNSLLKALGYLNVFIKALTGIDFLARANAKALKAQASAQKELNNQTYDFDVIRRQQDNSSSGGGGVGGSDLFQIPELDEKVVAKLQKLAEWLKKNEDLIKAVGKALLAVFGAVAIAKILKSIGALLGIGGLGGLSSTLSTLAQIGIIAIGVNLLYTAITGRQLIDDLTEIIDRYQKLKEITAENTKQEEKHTEALSNLNEQMIENIETGEASTEQIDITKKHLEGQTTAIENQIKEIEKQFIKTQEMKKQEEDLAKQLQSNIAVYDALYKQNLLNKQETESYMNTILDLIVVKEKLGEDTTDLRTKYDKLRDQTNKNRDANNQLKDSATAIGDKYSELTRKDWNIILKANDDDALWKLDRISRKLGDLTNRTYTLAIDAVEDFMRNTGYTGYATGGIVTQPTRALIGEAGYPEAVLPMTPDYLSTLAGEIARYGNNGNGNQPINLYVDGRLIQRQVANRQNQRNFITNT